MEQSEATSMSQIFGIRLVDAIRALSAGWAVTREVTWNMRGFEAAGCGVLGIGAYGAA